MQDNALVNPRMHYMLQHTVEPFKGELSGKTATKARLDMSARGLWGTHENTFFDIGSLTLLLTLIWPNH